MFMEFLSCVFGENGLVMRPLSRGETQTRTEFDDIFH